MSNLKIYRSSAGSGKTFTLVLEYLQLVLKHPEEYKSVLAITFTNKAAEEMKSRIIRALVSLSKNEETPIQKILSGTFPDMNISVQANKVLKNILHDYTSFSVTTIDSFFQRILRALAREIHLPLNMQIEVETDDAILDVTDRLMKEIGVDDDLTKWLTELAIQKINDEKGWNLEGDIKTVAKELFKEEHHNAKVYSREEIHKQYSILGSSVGSFENKMKELGTSAIGNISKHGYSVEDFAYGKSGVAGYLKKITHIDSPDDFKPSKRTLEALTDAQKWSTKTNPNRNDIVDLASTELIPILRQIIDYYETHYKEYITAFEVKRRIYLFGLVNDLQKKFSEYRNENNVILLSDTTRLLHDVIEGNDAPFIYEKSGNRYKHLLIDEFQDTSILQWKNLLPLIVNSLGGGFRTLIVGDAKQSVYRWRGGNMNLLISDLFNDLVQFKSMIREDVLSKNFRSRKNIIEFNNSFFLKAPAIANEQMAMNDYPTLKLAYNDELSQTIHRENENGGYVRINFYTNDKSEEDDNSGWKKKSMDGMLATIHELTGKGYSYSDICILVRSNREGNEVANWLFGNNIRQIISPDSLLLTASPKIEFLINVFRFISDNTDNIARTEIIYYYQRYINGQNISEWHTVFTDHKRSGLKGRKKNTANETLFEGLENNEFNRLLPEEFTSRLSQLRKLPVYELCEQVVSIFSMNKIPDAYIQRFQDLVMEYSTRINSSLNGFLDWYSFSNKVQKTSIEVPENTNAIRIMTIHGAKGLQFPVIMIPFAEWDLLPKPNEITWMNTKGTPVEIDRVAVMTSKRLHETFFDKEYRDEINQTVIDNLNLLYVAFTRAEDVLYVSCIADNNKDLNSVSKLIYRTCCNVYPDWNGDYLEIGKSEKHQPKKSNTIIQTEYLEKYPISNWQSKMTLSSHSEDLLAMTDKQITKINYGILVHQVLSEIEEMGDIELILQRKVFEGLIHDAEKDQLREMIEDLFKTGAIKELFSKTYETKAETELIMPGGEILRPDRVIMKDNIATVIDFKSGRRDIKHETQLLNYMEALRKMNFTKVNGKIVYLAEKVVIDIQH